MNDNLKNKTSEEIASDIFDNVHIEKTETSDIAKEIVKAQFKNRIKNVIEDDDSTDNFKRKFDNNENLKGCFNITLIGLICWLVVVLIIFLAFNA